MMMMMMMMMMCKRFAQVPMLCVQIYNMKLAMMQTTPSFTTFSVHTKMTAEKRGQDEVFGCNHTTYKNGDLEDGVLLFYQHYIIFMGFFI